MGLKSYILIINKKLLAPIKLVTFWDFICYTFDLKFLDMSQKLFDCPNSGSFSQDQPLMTLDC